MVVGVLEMVVLGLAFFGGLDNVDRFKYNLSRPTFIFCRGEAKNCGHLFRGDRLTCVS